MFHNESRQLKHERACDDDSAEISVENSYSKIALEMLSKNQVVIYGTSEELQIMRDVVVSDNI